MIDFGSKQVIKYGSSLSEEEQMGFRLFGCCYHLISVVKSLKSGGGVNIKLTRLARC